MDAPDPNHPTRVRYATSPSPVMGHGNEPRHGGAFSFRAIPSYNPPAADCGSYCASQREHAALDRCQAIGGATALHTARIRLGTPELTCS